MTDRKSELMTRRQALAVAGVLLGTAGAAGLVKALHLGSENYGAEFAEQLLPPEVLKVIPEVSGIKTTETLKILTAIPTWVFNYIPLPLNRDYLVKMWEYGDSLSQSFVELFARGNSAVRTKDVNGRLAWIANINNEEVGFWTEPWGMRSRYAFFVRDDQPLPSWTKLTNNSPAVTRFLYDENGRPLYSLSVTSQTYNLLGFPTEVYQSTVRVKSGDPTYELFGQEVVNNMMGRISWGRQNQRSYDQFLKEYEQFRNVEFSGVSFKLPIPSRELYENHPEGYLFANPGKG